MLEHGGPSDSRTFAIGSWGSGGLHRQRSHCLLQGCKAPVVPRDVERIELRGGVIQLLLKIVEVTAVASIRTQILDEAIYCQA